MALEAARAGNLARQRERLEEVLAAMVEEA